MTTLERLVAHEPVATAVQRRMEAGYCKAYAEEAVAQLHGIAISTVQTSCSTYFALLNRKAS